MINLVCLDMAGTTVNDDGAVMAAFGRALNEVEIRHGTSEHATAMEYAQVTMGQSKIAVFRAITDGDEDRAQRANGAFEKAYLDGLATGGARPVDGAEDALRRLRGSGRRVALTTGFSPTTRDALLESLGWAGLVDLALSPADAGRGRPYPDMVLAALLRLQIDDVREVAVVGDTVSDLLTGTRSGAAVVAGVLTGAHTADDFATVPHTHVLASVADLLPALDPS